MKVNRMAGRAGSPGWIACMILLCGFWILSASSAWAQIEGDTLGSEEELYNEQGEFIGTKSGETEEDWKDVSDEEKKEDSLRKIVAIRTDVLDPEALMETGEGRRTATFRYEELLYSDVIDRLGGFAMTLGQWGLPYIRYKYGTESANIEEKAFINPITGMEDAYFIDPIRGGRYYDTRTPYLNAYYGQGKADLSQMRVDVAQNYHPLGNIAALYERRQCAGVFSNHVTDQNSVGLSTNFHTFDDRYQVFAHWLYQTHNDEINGGVVPILPDSIFFDGGSQPVALDGAQLRRQSSAIAYRQFYRLTNDSIPGRHFLQVYNGGSVDRTLQQFRDESVSANISTSFFPVYPTLAGETTLAEKMRLDRLRLDAGLTYRYSGSKLQSNQRLELAQELGRFVRFVRDTDVRRTSLLWRGHVSRENAENSWTVGWNYRQTLSNLFKPETYAGLDLAYRFGPLIQDFSYKVPGKGVNPMDSIAVSQAHRALGIVFRNVSYGRNPSLQMTQGDVWPGNAYQVHPSFSNRRINHFTLGFELRGKDSHGMVGGVQNGNRLRISAFSTRQAAMIYYAPTGDLIQAGRKEALTVAGGELYLRFHLGRFWLESTTVVQGLSANSTRLDDQFAESQPKFYTRNSLFYEARDIKIAHLLRFGLDYWYFSSYDAPYYDPLNMTIYAQGQSTEYYQFAYPRADVWAQAQVKKANIYVKFINLLEGLPQAGYFTTMGYPMPVRQLQLGVNWTFFD